MIQFGAYHDILGEAKTLLAEGKIDDLKKMIFDSLKYVNDENVLSTMIDVIQEPVIRENLDKWASSKSLPPAMVEMLVGKLIKAREITTQQKVKFAKDLAEGNYYLDFGGMLKASESSKVNPADHFQVDEQVAEWLFASTKSESNKALLAAPTNVGKGEIPLIILGGLSKPSKGDLEYGSSMIEVKEGSGAGMLPKGMVHPTKFLKDMQEILKKKLPADVFAKVPKQLGNAGNTLALLLSISDKRGFPFGEFCKENKIPVKTCKDIMQQYIDKVYSYKFDVKKYIGNDYKMDIAGFGKDSFTQSFAQYQKEYGYSHLMYIFSGAARTAPFIYSMKSKADAEKFYDACGICVFSGGDTFGRANAFGGTYSVSKMKKNLK